MSGTEIVLLVTAILLVDGLIVLGLRMLAMSTFEELARAYPPRPRRGSTAARRYQSIAVGWLNFGNSFEIARDDEHVHFAPMLVARWFGAKPFSVPLAALGEAGAVHRHGRVVKLGKLRLGAPKWALTPREASAAR